MGQIKDFLETVTTEVDKIFDTTFSYKTTSTVPNVEDNSDLTYSNGDEKKGLELNTCVLFVDIRDSVKIKDCHYHNTLGRIYTSFTVSVLRVAKHYGGYVRNIIGDRVMVVFDEHNCFKNAVECAVTINHIASYIISQKVPEFRVGIGIDYGKMRIYKVGIITKGSENAENKNLVWIGDTANFASRLTDMANKDMEKKYQVDIVKNAGYMGSIREKKTHTATSLAEYLTKLNPIDFDCIVSVDAQQPGRYSAIMITEDVLNGYKKANPNCNSVKNGWWLKAHGDFRGVTKNVYQASLFWDIK